MSAPTEGLPARSSRARPGPLSSERAQMRGSCSCRRVVCCRGLCPTCCFSVIISHTSAFTAKLPPALPPVEMRLSPGILFSVEHVPRVTVANLSLEADHLSLVENLSFSTSSGGQPRNCFMSGNELPRGARVGATRANTRKERSSCRSRRQLLLLWFDVNYKILINTHS